MSRLAPAGRWRRCPPSGPRTPCPPSAGRYLLQGGIPSSSPHDYSSLASTAVMPFCFRKRTRACRPTRRARGPPWRVAGSRQPGKRPPSIQPMIVCWLTPRRSASWPVVNSSWPRPTTMSGPPEQLALAGVLQFEERLGVLDGQEPAQHARLPPARWRPFNDAEKAQLLTGIAVPTTLTASLPKQLAGDEDHGGHQICSTLLTPRAPGVGGGIVSSAVKARGALGAERLPDVSMSVRVIDTFTPSSVSN